MRLQSWEVFPDHSSNSNPRHPSNASQPRNSSDARVSEAPASQSRLLPTPILCVKLREPGIHLNTTNIADNPKCISEKFPEGVVGPWKV